MYTMASQQRPRKAHLFSAAADDEKLTEEVREYRDTVTTDACWEENRASDSKGSR